MESDWEQFLESLNQKIEAKLSPLEAELSDQDELIRKLSLNLNAISNLLQAKHGKLVPANEDKASHGKPSANGENLHEKAPAEIDVEHNEVVKVDS